MFLMGLTMQACSGVHSCASDCNDSGISTLIARAPIPVSLDSCHSRSLPNRFYGSNGQQRDFDWQTTVTNKHGLQFKDVLPTMNMGILRFPVGTGSNYWDWKSGKFLPFYGHSIPGGWPLSELALELSETGATPIFAMNLLTNPVATSDADTLGPNEDYSLNPTTGLLATAKSLNIPLPYLELGNEFYFPGPVSFPSDPSDKNGDNIAVYPDAGTYGTTASAWISNIHAQGSTHHCAAVGAHAVNAARQQTWNEGLFKTLEGEDAVTLHFYPQTNLPWGTNPTSSDRITATNAKQMLAVPFLIFQEVQDKDFAPNGAIPATVPVWVTEYNVDNQEPLHHGTWAHGLCLAGMSLKFLEEPQIELMVHHEVVGPGAYGDIFQDANGLRAVPGATNFSTVQWGLSAAGLTSLQINTAAKGQSRAQALKFAGTPTITAVNSATGETITYPALYGWMFSGASQAQLVMLNFFDQPLPVDLSALISNGAAYVQISGDPGAYVLDGAYSTAATLSGASDDLTQTTGSLMNSKSFSLPAFSITRITLAVQ
jgi:hypothetical protein